VTDQSDMIQEVADDFWRKHFYDAPLEFVNYAIPKLKGPQGFFKIFFSVKVSAVKIIPQFAKPELNHLPAFRKAYQQLTRRWPDSREAVSQVLQSPALNGKYYGSLNPDPKAPNMTKRDLKILALVDSMDRFVNSRSNGFPLFKDFEKFTTTYLSQKTRKNQTAPEHDFFDVCEKIHRCGTSLKADIDLYLLYLKTQIFRFANAELTERKIKKNICFFEDLLIQVQNALEGGRGRALADAVGEKYKAALVDEFQDTDNVQYDIFTTLFSSKDHLLFMIGDPKQAIYGFRGADIFSYLQASRNAASKFTLTKNWRSDPNLITAVNAIFSNVERSFVYDEIPFEKGSPGEPESVNHKNSEAPLIMWVVNWKDIYEEEKIINKTDALPYIAAAVAEEIRELISPGPMPVAREDIAVLVRTNRQARIIKHYLSAKGIPSVLHSTGNIFDSQEAMEMEVILTAISEPGNIAYLKAALVMDSMGVKGEQLVTADQNPAWWDLQLTHFQEYHHLWKHDGFIRMFRCFSENEHLKEHLLVFRDGERRLTNILHLAEILHQVSIEKNLGITGLTKWLAQQRDPSSPRLEEHQLRLESDEHAVKIVTIHKSKGLEYPVVFCPYAWESFKIKADEVIYHDVDEELQLTLDLGSDSRKQHLILAQNERLAENLRLLYVALTRAKRRCYLVWGQINTAQTSAMAYLFHGSDIAAGQNRSSEDILASLKERVTAKTEAEVLADLDILARKSKGTISVMSPPRSSDQIYSLLPEQKESMLCRNFQGYIDHTWRISSYSALVSARTRDVDLPDHDVYRTAIGRMLDLRPDDSGPHERLGFSDIFSFPKGSRAGIFFHDIFEHINFAATSQDDLNHLVAQKLQTYGFEKKWQQTICTAVTNVLNMPLPPGRNDFTLTNIASSNRINEMEFYFPMNPVTPETLQKVFNDAGGIESAPDYHGQLEKLVFSPTAGFMKGFIDLVFQHDGKFYLVDWKSNYLGPSVESYNPASLAESMKENLYTLQYHLYTLALYQLLRLRMPAFDYETDFGGVFYIFIRGVGDPRDPHSGVFQDFPRLALINRLGEALIPDFQIK